MTTLDEEDLRRKLISGTKWAASLRLLSQLISWLVTIFVVRYLSADDYGLNAMLEVPIELFMLFSTIGIDMALVRGKASSDKELAEAFGLLLVVNGLFFLLMLGVSGYLANYFNEPRLALLIQVTSVVFLISPFRTIPNALLDRELAFKLKSQAECIATIIASLLCFVLAFLGAGVWALVSAVLATAILRALFLAYLRPWMIRPRFRFTAVGSMVRYGGVITLGGVVLLVAGKSVHVIAGPVIGVEALGYFAVAGQFAMLPLSKIMPIMQQSLYPAFAKIEGSPALAKTYLLKSIELTALLVFPLAIGMSCVAHRFVPVLFGEQWLPMATPLALWAAITPVRMISNLYVPALNGLGQARQILIINGILLILLGGGAFYARDYGVIGLVLLWVVVNPVYLFLTLFLSRQVLPVGLGALMKAIMPAGVPSLAMAAILFLLEWLFPGESTAVRLAADIALGAVVYVSVLFLFFPSCTTVIRKHLL